MRSAAVSDAMAIVVRAAAAALAVVCLAACDTDPAASSSAAQEPFDLVFAGGRVLDPESGLDGIRNVGIRDGRIAAVAEGDLVGAEVVAAGGLVVAPGFIDLHAHGQDAVSSRYQAMDGVTTALELEIGAFPVGRWYARRDGAARLHYGASVSHQGARIRAMRSPFALSNADGTFSLGNSTDDALYRAATDEERDGLQRLMEQGLRDGGIGFGYGISYTPGASHRELLELFGLAARYDAPSFVHLRSAAAFSRGGALAPFQEVIANAAVTGAPLHIVHLNSTAGARAEEALAMIRGARERGLDVTTEAYPYTASASLIESPLFDGWSGRPAVAYERLQWVETGERLTAETFERYRRQGGWVIMHGRSEATNEWIVSQPDVMAASDGIPFSGGARAPAGGRHLRPHPRALRPRARRAVPDGRPAQDDAPAGRAPRGHRPRHGAQGPRAGGKRCRPDALRPRARHRPRHVRGPRPLLGRHRARPRRRHVRRPRRRPGRRRHPGPAAPRPAPGSGLDAR